MITSFAIKNFRCFRQVKVENCSLINIIVGDNGTGKTTVLEGLFFALASTTELAARFRHQRGLEGAFQGPPKTVEEAIWRDFFFRRDWSQPIEIAIEGDGPEGRTLKISRGTAPNVSYPVGESRPLSVPQASGAISVCWTDANGEERCVFPAVSQHGIRFDSTDEDLAPFFYFSAAHMPSSAENAARFSHLSQTQGTDEFVRAFRSEYKWIEGLSIEVNGGAPVIYASIAGQKEKIAVPNISGGINKMLAIMLSIASSPNSVVLVDEMENGIFHTHHRSLWKSVIALARKNNTQLIATSHSQEWVEALIEAAGKRVSDIALWRVERGKEQPRIAQFSGDKLHAGIEHEVDIRGRV